MSGGMSRNGRSPEPSGRPYYLHSGGFANSINGDGSLSTELPVEGRSDMFAYDPLNPVPTTGGCNCCNPEVVPWGVYDQRTVEFRDDVLVYTSAPLEQDLEVTGPIIMHLWASTDGPDTDFTAKLCDVYPDGRAWNLCDGIVRARYRNGTSAGESGRHRARCTTSRSIAG